MARRNPKIVELEEKLRKANLRADNEEELKHRVQGKLEKYEEQERRERDDQMSLIHSLERNQERLESEISWMRRLVEQLCIPADKLKVLEETRINQVQIGHDPRRPY